MLLLALATALIASPPTAQGPTAATAQARATVRIISATRIRLDGQPSADAPAPSDAIIHTGGTAQPARLVEFQ